MKITQILLVLCLSLIFISACTSTRTKQDQGIQMDEHGMVIDPFYDIPGQDDTQTHEESAVDERYPQPSTSGANVSDKSTSKTVLALLNQAKIQEQSGDSERAAAVLERALRIEPKNAQLWHRLALLRLQQGKLALAESLAAKSNALAHGDDLLHRKNKTIIEQARILQGKD